jgi:hypothetical protein
MRKRKETGLEPMPRTVRNWLAALAVIFVVFVLVAGKYSLANWRANAVFLPVVLFIGLLLVAATARSTIQKASADSFGQS